LPASATDLRKQLLRAGIAKGAIDAAWPEWWSDAGDESRSARTELRYELARRLGLSPRALLKEQVEFSRSQNARFKHLTAETAEQQALLASFGTALGSLLIRATPASKFELSNDPFVLRSAILESKPFVGLDSLVASCWGLGIPVIQLRVFPLATKSMHAMVAGANSRHAILIGFAAKYPAQAAFTLAHEMGHIALGHLPEGGTIVDLDEIGNRDETDAQEREADEFALTLLAGSPKPEITTSLARYNSTSLATAVVEQGPPLGIEPGTLALCLAYQTGEWNKAMSALRQIYGGPNDMWRFFNGFAGTQIEWDAIGDEAAEYLKRIMGASD
jgi:hypothetical protein